MLENFPYGKGPQKAQSVRFTEHPAPTLPNNSSQTRIPEGPKGWLRQEDRHKLEDSLDCTVKPCLKKEKRPGVVLCPCNPSTSEAEAGGLSQVGGHPELNSETLFQAKSWMDTEKSHRWQSSQKAPDIKT